MNRKIEVRCGCRRGYLLGTISVSERLELQSGELIVLPLKADPENPAMTLGQNIQLLYGEFVPDTQKLTKLVGVDAYVEIKKHGAFSSMNYPLKVLRRIEGWENA